MRVYLLLICSTIGCLLLPQQVAAEPFEWPVSASGNGHRYEVVASPMTWDQAKIEAERRGGYLATLTTRAEYDFVLKLSQTSDGKFDTQFWSRGQGARLFGPWIGAYQTPGESNPRAGWSWVSGEPFEFTAWHSGEPNDYGGSREDVAVLYFNQGVGGVPGWNDSGRGYRRPFIVEFDPPAAPQNVIAPPVAPIAPRAVRPRPDEPPAPRVAHVPAAAPAAEPASASAEGESLSPRKLIGIVVLIIGLIGTPIVGFVAYFACRIALRDHDRRRK